MREWRARIGGEGDFVEFSKLPKYDLQLIASGACFSSVECDIQAARIYAAILVKERT